MALECFARFKEGFCQYYATTMAAILRDVGIPARIVEGFLPGDLDTRTGIETIQFSKAHAWVEVYFPGYGWVRFDPTSPSVSQAQVAAVRAAARQRGAARLDELRPPERRAIPGASATKARAASSCRPAAAASARSSASGSCSSSSSWWSRSWPGAAVHGGPRAPTAPTAR